VPPAHRSRRKDTGKWEVRWRENGRNRSKSFTHKADAQRFEADVHRAQETGRPLEFDRGKDLLSDFVRIWWRRHVVPNLAKNTRDSYGPIWNKHVRPELGGYRLRDITPGVVDQFKADLITAGVGPSVVHKSLAILSGMFTCAVKWDYIDRNPVDAVKIPTPKRARFVRPLAPVTVEAIRAELLAQGRLLDATLVSVWAYAGLRPGEARALQWGDIGDHAIRVERAAAGTEIKTTKTGRLRTVDLLGPLAADLQRWRQASKSTDEQSLVFPTPRGTLWSDDDWDNWRDREYVPVARQVGSLGPPYDLRHSFASLRIAEGWTAVEVAMQMGDAPQITLGHYAPQFTEFDRGARTSAVELIAVARARLDIREMYADPTVELPVKSPEPSPLLEADARIRTADPFITR
jgi:integrase